MRTFYQAPIRPIDGITPHDLFKPFIESGMALYQLRHKLGGRPSEPVLSKMLRGIAAMPADMADRIKKALG